MTRAAEPPARPEHPVLIINPRSGGCTAARVGLESACAARGIQPVVLGADDDVESLARDAIAHGADAIGVAGGDGTQGLVAAVASEHELPYVCIPAGTRNHFAFDLGVDRNDVVGALDAFSHGVERRIDLARLNERVFVNNASLGVYAAIVRDASYRDAKRDTVARLLPDLVPPRAEPFPVRFVTPDGTTWDGAELVLVSNDPYRLPPPGARGTRGALDRGVLGIVAVRDGTPKSVGALVAAQSSGAIPRLPGIVEFTASVFVVDADAAVDVALDGESCVVEPPLRFESLPSALRIRVLPRKRLARR